MAKESKSKSSPAAEKKPAAKSAETSKPAVAPKATAAPKAAAAAVKPALKKPAAKKPAPATTANMPQIDTGLAAQSAAAMLVNRDTLTDASHGGAKAESSTFKNMKDQIAKPKPAGLSHILGIGGDQKKGPGHFMNQQRGHNQTSGGFNKTGVPRRTNG